MYTKNIFLAYCLASSPIVIHARGGSFIIIIMGPGSSTGPSTGSLASEYSLVLVLVLELMNIHCDVVQVGDNI